MGIGGVFMVKRWIILTSVIIMLIPAAGYGESTPSPGTTTIAGTSTPTLDVDVLFPGCGRPKWGEEGEKRVRISAKIEVVSGVIGVVARIHPSSGRHISEKGYIIQYFIDNKLVCEHKDVHEDKKGIIDRQWEWNTTGYLDGIYTLTINLWDKHASVGVGMVRVRIENSQEEKGDVK